MDSALNTALQALHKAVASLPTRETTIRPLRVGVHFEFDDGVGGTYIARADALERGELRLSKIDGGGGIEVGTLLDVLSATGLMPAVLVDVTPRERSPAEISPQREAIGMLQSSFARRKS